MARSHVPALRSVGPGAATVAARTREALTTLVGDPGAHLFHGVRTAGVRPATVVHAVVAGRLVVLVTGVVWPAGDYQVEPNGRVRCDGVYIGQSVQPLRRAAQWWRERLPDQPQVEAMVVVHADGPGGYALPKTTWADLAWSMAETFVDRLRSRCGRRPRAASGPVLDALATAASGPARPPEAYR